MPYYLLSRLYGWERLDDRLTPTVTFRFDYRFDTAGFFSDPARREALDRAAADLGSRIDSSLDAITPSSGNIWSATVYQPVARAWVAIDNLTVNRDEMVVFVGAGFSGTDDLASATTGGYKGFGSVDWLDTLQTRGHVGYANWGGTIAFDPSQSWYFGADPAGLMSNQSDFYTVATHELGHLLGFGTSTQFSNLISGDEFLGPASATVLGSTPLLSPEGEHWVQGTTLAGRQTSMQPHLVADTRYGFSELDYAALKDIGWSVTAAPVSPIRVGTFAPVVAPPSSFTILSGRSGGTAQLFHLTATGLDPVGPAVRPFEDFGGEVRGVVGDFNGDGVPDVAFATGPGGGSRIRILDGRTFADLTPVWSAFESSFTGGVFLAAADLDGDGRDELIVTPDVGGGGRVSIFALGSGSMTTTANFFGIDDPAFRGGARVAAADVTGDGRPDLVVAAGAGGGPRVALFDGRFVSGAFRPPPKVVPDFFAFSGGDATSLSNGVFVAAGDLNGDGHADLVFGGGPGGGPRVLAISGYSLISNISAAFAHPLVNGFAFDPADRGGVRVAVKTDLSGHSVLFADNGGVMRLTAAGNSLTSWTPLDTSAFANGAYVG